MLSRAALLAAVLAGMPAARAGTAGGVVDFVHVDGFEASFDCTQQDLACSTPPAGRVCLSGRMAEAGTSRGLRSFRFAERSCAEGAIGGACDLRIRTYDAIELAANPTAAMPLAADVFVDGCGRFRITDQAAPAFGFLAIVVDDADAAAPGDVHVPSARMLPVSADSQVEDLALVVARRDTVAVWTEAAGSPFGPSSFADVGVILFTFRAATVPVAGVTVVRNGSTQPALDWYFTDSVATERSQASAAVVATGPNGSALFTDGNLSSYTGMGGEPGGCVWSAANAAAIPGYVVFVPLGC